MEHKETEIGGTTRVTTNPLQEALNPLKASQASLIVIYNFYHCLEDKSLLNVVKAIRKFQETEFRGLPMKID